MAIKSRPPSNPATTNPNSSPPTSSPPRPSLPPLTHAKLSPRAYLSAHLASPSCLRPSARTLTEARPISVHTGSLTHAHGSAVVKVGDTSVVCGVRGEVLRREDVADYVPRRKRRASPEGEEEEGEGEAGEENEEEQERRRREDAQEIEKLGLLVPNIELATGCSPAHLPGGPPSPLAQTLTARLLTLLHTTHLIPLSSLEIWSQPPASPSAEDEAQVEGGRPEIKGWWTLYIDILFISLSGPAFDSAWFALLAALTSVRLPHAYYNPDSDSILCDPDPASYHSLHINITEMPVALTFGVFTSTSKEIGAKKGKTWLLTDADGFEEGVCEGWITIVVRSGERIVRIEKDGAGALGIKELKACTEGAERRREEWSAVLGKDGVS